MRDGLTALGREPAVTVVLDGVGGAIGHGAVELLGPGGRLVVFGWSSGELIDLDMAALFARALTVSAGVGARLARHPRGLRPFEERALAAATRGELRPLVQRFALADAAAAHEAIERRATTGKVVLVP